MPRKRRLTPGEHRAFVTSRAQGEKKPTESTPRCSCGWRGETSTSRTGALDQFDAHIKEMKSA